MRPRTVTHTTFTIERTYPVAPRRVFAAFADPSIKERWFQMPAEWVGKEHTLDFRVGGREHSRGGPADGPVHVFDAVFQDIVDGERIVYTYLDGLEDPAEREHGTNLLLDALAGAFATGALD